MDPPQPITAEQRQWFAEELQRAKLEAIKELAYGASHEINNPLANIALRAQTLLKREDDPSKRKALEAMHRASMRGHEMISDMMLFARPPAASKRPIDLRDVVAEVVKELAPRAEELGTKLAAETPKEPVDTVADPDQMIIAVRALVENSFDALGQGGDVVVSTSRTGSEAILEVADNGPSVPDEIRPHVFDPFFSGREAGRGLGFGLPKCWRLVTEHGGTVRLDSKSGRGVTVTIRLPTR